MGEIRSSEIDKNRQKITFIYQRIHVDAGENRKKTFPGGVKRG
jgi:hypothetical protein